nr:DUF72 domain-containing protein [Pectobacterium brasiliense]
MYIGLPQWQHPAWSRLGLNDLADYSRYFTCVEGNTTFYALPSREVVERWRDMTHDDFHFCFKSAFSTVNVVNMQENWLRPTSVLRPLSSSTASTLSFFSPIVFLSPWLE